MTRFYKRARHLSITKRMELWARVSVPSAGRDALPAVELPAPASFSEKVVAGAQNFGHFPSLRPGDVMGNARQEIETVIGHVRLAVQINAHAPNEDR